MNVGAILDSIVSHAMASGLFERVNSHEPKNAPGNGLSAAIWAQEILPLPDMSGLAATTGLVIFNVRVYVPMLTEPQDGIDTTILTAVDTLMTAYSGDFEMAGAARNIDLLGESGRTLSAKAGYLEQDKKLFRVMVIEMPVIVNDLWAQAP